MKEPSPAKRRLLNQIAILGSGKPPMYHPSAHEWRTARAASILGLVKFIHRGEDRYGYVLTPLGEKTLRETSE